MKKYGIVIDSTTYLSEEQCKELGIHKVSLYVVDGDDVYEELKIDNKFVFDKLDSGNRLTTSQPAPGVFLETYEKLLEEYEFLFIMTISEPLSGTYQSAKLAVSMLDDPNRVHQFTSKMASFGNELNVLKLAEFIKQDLPKEEIIERVQKINDRSELIITVENLISMFRSGRLSRTKAAIGTVLRVKPIIRMVNGKLDLYKAARSNKKVFAEYIEQMREDAAKYEKFYVRIQNKNSDENVNTLEAMVRENFPHAEITRNDYLGPVFSVHVGKKGYGICWSGE